MYDIDRIYNTDFRNALGNLPPIDLVATDPPYNIGFKYNSYADNLKADEYKQLLANLKDMPLAIIHYPENTMRDVVPALGVPNEVIAWCYNSSIRRQFRLINFYNVAVDFGAVRQPYKNLNDKRVQARIAAGSKGARLYDWFSDIHNVKNVSKERGIHPCPVPVKLMERIILLTTKKGDTVLDPFMGGGTTAIACINTDRHYIGFEIDKLYYDAAVERIKKHLSEKSICVT
ncbi:MAG: site-specific DNA-methyltransferase [Clostridiales bacterium]|nr:site-specific DNA-methyltransferase [Clostridiales bacterium]